MPGRQGWPVHLCRATDHADDLAISGGAGRAGLRPWWEHGYVPDMFSFNRLVFLDMRRQVYFVQALDIAVEVTTVPLALGRC